MESLQAQQAPNAANRFRKPVVIWGIALGVLLLGYVILCGVAAGRHTFYKHTKLNNVDVGGMTVTQAEEKLKRVLPANTCDIYVNGDAEKPAASVSFSDLGVSEQSDFASMAEDGIAQMRSGNFWTGGIWLFNGLTQGQSYTTAISWDSKQFAETAAALADSLTNASQGTAFSLGTDCVQVTTAVDGRTVSADAVTAAFDEICYDGSVPAVTVRADTDPAQVLTAQEIYDAVSGKMKNAGYDAATETITEAQSGVEFDVKEADALLDAAQPGEVVEIPATIEAPAVTAEQLKGVLFRDVIGTYTTHVGGTKARINNVKLSTAAVNGTVLNCGDVFSYNETVGRRVASKGYQSAPAYVQGETVDEIGGGVCQPSSTLYYASLLANLEIVQRSAHRYVPAYITKGIDATVSWGGPDYQFSNNTNYPIKIVAAFSNGYLTMKLLGTRVDNTYVKMVSNVLSTTPYQTIRRNDSTLAAGTQQIKVTPYTGYKVETYRNIYDGNGELLSSKLEAVSNYKVRDKIVLVGLKKQVPAVAPSVAEPAAGTATLPETEPSTEPSTESSTEPSTEPSMEPSTVPGDPPIA